MKSLLVIVAFFLIILFGFIFFSKKLNSDISIRENELTCISNFRTYLSKLKESIIVSVSTNSGTISNFDYLKEVDSKTSCLNISKEFEKQIQTIKTTLSKIENSSNISNDEIVTFNNAISELNTSLK